MFSILFKIKYIGFKKDKVNKFSFRIRIDGLKNMFVVKITVKGLIKKVLIILFINEKAKVCCKFILEEIS